MMQQKMRNRHLVAGVVMVCAVLLASAAMAAQTLMISPARIIFTGKQRAIQASVTNPADKAVRYTVEVVPQRQGNDGKWRLPTGELTAEEKALKKMIRFSPRRATVKSRSSQAVKFMLRKSANLPPGEYRYFLRLTPHEPEFVKRSAKEAPEESGGDDEGLAMNVRLIVTANFPLIVFHEVPLVRVEAVALQLQADPQAKSGYAAVVRVRRGGEVSSFGNMTLSYLAPGASEAQKRRVGRMLGVALYAPERERTLTFPLDKVTPAELKSGTLLFEYSPKPGYKKRKALTSKRFSL